MRAGIIRACIIDICYPYKIYDVFKNRIEISGARIKSTRTIESIQIFYVFTFHCSYSRQNLLSSGNTKSNEIDQPQAHITHNNLPLTIGNKFRNQINQNTPPDVLNVNQQRHCHDVFDNSTTNTNYNNLKVGGSGSSGSGGATAPTSSAVVNSMPTTDIASIFTAGINSVQGTPSASSSVGTSVNRESNLLNSIANNENRYVFTCLFSFCTQGGYYFLKHPVFFCLIQVYR